MGWHGVWTFEEQTGQYWPQSCGSTGQYKPKDLDIPLLVPLLVSTPAKRPQEGPKEIYGNEHAEHTLSGNLSNLLLDGMRNSILNPVDPSTNTFTDSLLSNGMTDDDIFDHDCVPDPSTKQSDDSPTLSMDQATECCATTADDTTPIKTRIVDPLQTSNKSLTLLESQITDKQVSRLYRNLSDQAVQGEQIEEEQQDKINTLNKQLSDLSLDLENEREKVRQPRRDLKMMKAQVSDRDVDIKQLERTLEQNKQDLARQKKTSNKLEWQRDEMRRTGYCGDDQKHSLGNENSALCWDNWRMNERIDCLYDQPTVMTAKCESLQQQYQTPAPTSTTSKACGSSQHQSPWILSIQSHIDRPNSQMWSQLQATTTDAPAQTVQRELHQRTSPMTLMFLRQPQVRQDLQTTSSPDAMPADRLQLQVRTVLARKHRRLLLYHRSP